MWVSKNKADIQTIFSSLVKKSGQYRFFIIVSVLWYLAFFPGRLGADGSGAIRMLQQGISTKWWTAIYFWFLRITSFDGKQIYLTSLIGIVGFVYSLLHMMNSLNHIFGKRATTATKIFFCTPLFGTFAVTIGHDIQQVTGLILLFSLHLLKFSGKFQDRIRRNVATYFVAGLFVSMTQIGIIFIVVSGTLLFTNRKYFLLGLSSFLLILLVVAISNFGISNSYMNYTKIGPMIADIKCVVQHPQALVNDSDWNTLQEIAPKIKWEEPISCKTIDLTLNHLGILDKEIKFSKSILRAYLDVCAKNTAICIMAHIQRSRAALPPPFFPPPDNQIKWDSDRPIGFGANTALQQGPELLHPSIDEESVKISLVFLLPLQVIAQLATFLFNQASWFWGWGGLWLWPIAILFLPLSNRWRFRKILTLLNEFIVLHSIMLLVGPGDPYRYWMFTICVGFISLFIIIIGRFGEENSPLKYGTEEK